MTREQKIQRMQEVSDPGILVDWIEHLSDDEITDLYSLVFEWQQEEAAE